MKKPILVIALLLGFVSALQAQKPYTIEGVRKAYLRSSGSILQNNEIKGYFVFYQSDKIDKKTVEYTVSILDENNNLIKNIVFEDDKNVRILESSYNESSIMFLFYNNKEKTLEYRAYDFTGKQVASYLKDLSNRSKNFLEATYKTTSEIAENEALFDLPNKGYVTVFPIREKKYYSYEINVFLTDRKKQWTFEAAEEQEDRWTKAIYLGNTDSLVLFEVLKQRTLIGGKPHSWILALDINTGRKVYEVITEETDNKLFPMTLVKVEGQSDIKLVGPYYNANDDVLKDKSLGLAIWSVNSKGKFTAKKFNSWENDFSKYVELDKRGKVKDVGFVYFHKIVQTTDGKFYAIGEGYNKVVSALGAISKGLSIIGGGGGSGISAFKVKVTDMMISEFDPNFAIKGVNIYDKFNNSVEMPGGAEFMSPHMMALFVRQIGGFDYDFTKMSNDRSTFTVGFSDYEKSGDYKGRTFNSISYKNGKLTQDKIKLDSKATMVRILPAKPGFISIMEYFKKEKRIELRLEKMN